MSDSDEEDLLQPGPQLDVDDAVEAVGFGRAQAPLLVSFGLTLALSSAVLFLAPFLTSVLRCEWSLTNIQAASFTLLVFLGAGAGGLVLGPLADHLGRRPVLLLSSAAAPYFLLLLAYSPSLHWLLLHASVVGFFAGGLQSISLAHTAEFLPVRWRTPVLLFLLALSASVTALLLPLLAWLLLARAGWRHFVLAWSLLMGLLGPPLILLAAPRSPRYLLLCGLPGHARFLLNRFAAANGRPPLRRPLGPVGDEAAVQSLGDPRRLLRRPALRTATVCQLVMWLCSGFAYVGSILVAVELPGSRRRCLQDLNNLHPRPPPGFSEFLPSDITDGAFPFPFADASGGHCVARRRCYELPYPTILLAALGELPGVLLNLFLLDWMGRRVSLVFLGLVSIALFILLTICSDAVVTGALLGAVRLAVRAFHTASVVYAVELFPCSVRVTAAGLLFAAYRLGCVLSPLVGQVMLLRDEVMTAMGVYAISMFAATVAALMLPTDTKGERMAQDVDELDARQ